MNCPLSAEHFVRTTDGGVKKDEKPADNELKDLDLTDDDFDLPNPDKGKK